MSNRAAHGQSVAIESALEDMVLWYMANTTKPHELPEVAVDKRAYKGIVMRWLEPILPGLDNPVLIEEQLGDYWSLRLEPMNREHKIT